MVLARILVRLNSAAHHYVQAYLGDLPKGEIFLRASSHGASQRLACLCRCLLPVPLPHVYKRLRSCADPEPT